MPRIDKLTPGTSVFLEMGRYGSQSDPSFEAAVFLGITGTGDEREARFLSADNDDSTYEWNAYRHNGRWAYGSSADYLRLSSVRHDPFAHPRS